jgi:hypothetical protein
MTTVQPEGEDLRKAVKWISDEKQFGPKKSLQELIDAACVKFDLSPKDALYLANFVQGEDED